MVISDFEDSDENDIQTIDWRGRDRRKRKAPPARLAWPPVISPDSSSVVSSSRVATSQSSRTRKSSNKKRRSNSSSLRQSSSSRSARKEEQQQSTQTWVDQHRPTKSGDLCVAPKKVKEIRAWLEAFSQGRTTQKLLVLAGSPGIGKSTAVNLIADEVGFATCGWSDDMKAQTWSRSDDIMSIETKSPLQSFEEFLQSVGSGFSALSLNIPGFQSSKKRSQNNVKRKLVLLEDWPHLHTPEAEARFRNMMEVHVRHSHVPTVLIFSDVSEGKHKPEDLERLIHPQILYSQEICCIMQINPVTRPKMKKLLQNIATAHGHYTISDAFQERIHQQSCGDLRHAILSLQLDCTGRRKSADLGSGKSPDKNRDTKLSTFHALGKVLYAKRKENNELDFDPDRTLEVSDMGLEGSIAFLEYHCVDMFTDIEELSKAMEYYSDTAHMLDSSTTMRTRNSVDNHNKFPHGYVASIAGRAIAATNTHRTANRFRAFSSPKVFDVYRKRKENMTTIQQLFRRLSVENDASLPSQHRSQDTLAVEVLPFVRQIIPGDVNPSIEQLHSMMQSRRLTINAQKDASAIEEQRLLKQQAEILQVDDIQDDSSTGDDGNNNDHNKVIRRPKTKQKGEKRPRKKTQPSIVRPKRPKSLTPSSSNTTKHPEIIELSD